MALLSIPKHSILAISLHTREKQGYSPGVIRRAGVVVFLALVGALALGGGVPLARAAATPPPSLKVEAIGQGTVTGLGINCGSGSLACYSAYGTDPQSVTLTATPASGWTFSRWQDGASACAGN